MLRKLTQLCTRRRYLHLYTVTEQVMEADCAIQPTILPVYLLPVLKPWSMVSRISEAADFLAT